MLGSLSGRVVVIGTVAVALAGGVDAVRGDNADLLVVFLLVAALQLALLVRLQFGRRPVPVRPDLAAWLEARSALTGEPPAAIAERSIAEYRASLRGDNG
ncbi:MAG: hypothetical protein AB1673_05830 [Actinomycetota bacterium]